MWQTGASLVVSTQYAQVNLGTMKRAIKCPVFNWSRKRTHEVACQGGIGFLENEADRGGSFPYVFEVSLEW